MPKPRKDRIFLEPPRLKWEFAGRLLVLKEKLLEEIRKHQKKIYEFRAIVEEGEEELLEAISRLRCDRFKVSGIVVQKRIRKEKISSKAFSFFWRLCGFILAALASIWRLKNILCPFACFT